MILRGVGVKNKKSLLFCVALFLFSLPVFSLDTTTDVLLGGFYNYSNVFTGKTKYQTYNGYDTVTVDGDYNAIFRAGGGSLGFDCFFNPSPFGVYFRSGLMSVSDVERRAGGVTDKINNTEIGYNVFLDIGGVYAFNLDNFSFNVAPSVSILFVNAQNRESIFKRVTLDSLFGVGMTADIYAKFRYKYFVCSAGFAVSFYPLTLVSSADTKIEYSTSIRNTMAYNLRPYISIGVSLRERTASTISAGGN